MKATNTVSFDVLTRIVLEPSDLKEMLGGVTVTMVDGGSTIEISLMSVEDANIPEPAHFTRMKVIKGGKND